MDRLKLEYMQVKQLCKFKLDLLDEETKFAISSDRVLQADLIMMFRELSTGLVSACLLTSVSVQGILRVCV